MAKQTIHYALDVGSDALKLVRFLPTRRPTVLSTSIHPLRPSESGEAVPVEEALRVFLKDEDPRALKPVYVSMPASHTFMRYITLPHIPEHKIDRIIVYEAEQQIPFPIDEVIWDFALLGGKRSEERDAVLAATKREAADSVVRALETLRFSVKLITANHIALCHLFTFMGLRRGNILSIDLGAQSTNLLMMDREQFWSRGLSHGGEKLTELIASEKGISPGDARRLLGRIRMTAGLAPEEKELADLAGRYFMDVLNEVSRTVSFYHAQVKDAAFDRVYLSGGLSSIPGLAGFFEKNLGIKTDRLEIDASFSVGADMIDDLRKTHTSFSVALGLAASRAGKMPVRINMVSTEVRERTRLHAQHEKYYLFGIMTVLALLLCLLNVYLEYGSKAEALRIQQAKLHYYRAERKVSDAVEDRLRHTEEKLALIKRNVRDKSTALDLFDELKARTPQSIWYRSLAYDNAARTINLEGATYGSLGDINHFADQLRTSALFETVEVVAAGIVDDVPKDAAVKASAEDEPPVRKWRAPGPERIFSLRITREAYRG